MALKSTIHKCELTVADIDRSYYATHSLTLARHPSETEERLMVRLFAFALYADERLEFGRGLSSDDEADLWQISRSGDIERWIDVGLPDERVLRRACGRAREVVLVAYGGRAVPMWWEANRLALERLSNLTVLELPSDVTAAMAAVCDRTMTLAATVQEGHMFLGDVAVEWGVLKLAR